VNPSFSFDSTPMAPIRSSSACCVAVLFPDDGEVSFPVAPRVRSTAGAMKPENSSALTAIAARDGCVTVIVSPSSRSVMMYAEKTTVRTPVVPEPFVTSASLV